MARKGDGGGGAAATRYTFRREEVVAALRVEPLLCRGAWIDIDHDGKLDSSDGYAVCAVGAVVRRCLRVSNRLVGTRCRQLTHSYSAGDPAERLAAGNYFGALSAVFEAAAGDIEAARAEAVAFVTAQFPETLVLDLDKDGFVVLPGRAA